ncbi:unnamed protein product [Tenebrio molitor]|nr:unnamed protein product [Tenebrio molitor]
MILFINTTKTFSTDINCKTGFIYFYPHIGMFDMDVNLSIICDRNSVTKILNVSHNDNKA